MHLRDAAGPEIASKQNSSDHSASVNDVDSPNIQVATFLTTEAAPKPVEKSSSRVLVPQTTVTTASNKTPKMSTKPFTAASSVAGDRLVESLKAKMSKSSSKANQDASDVNQSEDDTRKHFTPDKNSSNSQNKEKRISENRDPRKRFKEKSSLKKRGKIFTGTGSKERSRSDKHAELPKPTKDIETRDNSGDGPKHFRSRKTLSKNMLKPHQSGDKPKHKTLRQSQSKLDKTGDNFKQKSPRENVSEPDSTDDASKLTDKRTTEKLFPLQKSDCFADHSEDRRATEILAELNKSADLSKPTSSSVNWSTEDPATSKNQIELEKSDAVSKRRTSIEKRPGLKKSDDKFAELSHNTMTEYDTAAFTEFDTSPVQLETTGINQSELDKLEIFSHLKTSSENRSKPDRSASGSPLKSSDRGTVADSSEEHSLRIITSDEERFDISKHFRKRKSDRSHSPSKKRRWETFEKSSASDLESFLKKIHANDPLKDRSKQQTKKKHQSTTDKNEQNVSTITKAPVFETAGISIHKQLKTMTSPNRLTSPSKEGVVHKKTKKHFKKSPLKLISPLRKEKVNKRRVSLTSIPIPPSKLGGSPMHLRTPSPVLVCRDSPNTIALVAESLVELSRGSHPESAAPDTANVPPTAPQEKQPQNTSVSSSTSTQSSSTSLRKKKKSKQVSELNGLN